MRIFPRSTTREKSHSQNPDTLGSTVWAPFPADTNYFGASGQSHMFNYRVRNLDAMLEQLRAAGATVDENIQVMEFGKFGWATDPEGNRFELWEPAEGM